MELHSTSSTTNLHKFYDNQTDQVLSHLSSPVKHSDSSKKKLCINLSSFGSCEARLGQLKEELTKLADLPWTKDERKISALEEEIALLDGYVNNPNNRRLVEQKIKKIKRRRASCKRNRIKLRLQKEQLQSALLQKNLEIDQWLQFKWAEDERNREADSFKRELKLARRLIKKDIVSIKGYLDKLKLMEKMRVILSSSSSCPESDSLNFNATVCDLREKLLTMINTKNDEIEKIRVLIDHTDMVLKQPGRQELYSSNTNLSNILFGETEANSDDQYFKYINQGNSSINDFHRVRSQWDLYINDDGSSIPQKCHIRFLTTF
ncbi:uncharacterized protein LOC107370794 [Tetranychus urticae]|uniref:uncharacterized protein LOC107370794 n=1 Tax=Tetranychus urticae TaxID=32264 RepID=UPI00077BEA9D|nr:uncharacterized protein LOC107370794 [Tetranychus urticae]